jgi:hypothetical protein
MGIPEFGGESIGVVPERDFRTACLTGDEAGAVLVRMRGGVGLFVCVGTVFPLTRDTGI